LAITSADEETLPRIVLNNLSNDQTPNIVGFKGKERMIGEEALNLFVSSPENTITQVKRLLGLSSKDVKLAIETKRLPFTVHSKGDSQTVVKVNYRDNVLELSPEQIAAMVLEKLAQFGKAKAGKETEEPGTVVAVPSCYTESQRAALLAATTLSSLKPLYLIHETTAAAIYYAFTHNLFPAAPKEPETNNNTSTPAEGATNTNNDSPPKEAVKNIMFISIGHAFFEVAVVQFSKDKLKILSNVCDDTIGGRCFDWALYDHAAEQFQAKYSVAVSSSSKAVARLLRQAEKTKQILSTIPSTDMTIECLIGEKDYQGKVSSKIFEEICKGELERIKQHINTALQSAGLSIDQIEAVEGIGGGLRIPCVQETIKATLTSFPSTADPKRLSFTMDSAHCIAQGAGLFGKLLSGKSSYTIEDPFNKQVLFEPEKTRELFKDALALNAQLRNDDELLQQTNNKKYEIESFIYSKRDQCSDSKFVPSIISESEKQNILKILKEGDEWLQSLDPSELEFNQLNDKLNSMQTATNQACPKLHEHLLRLEEERKKAEQEAEEYRKNYKPETALKDRIEPRTKEEKIDFAKKKKHQGGVLFKDGDYEGAVQRWTQAVAYFDQIWDMTPDQQKDVTEIKSACYSNLAACYLKLKKYEKARDNCTEVLKIEKENTKALYRRGQAYYYLKEFELAKQDLTQASKLEPNNNDVKKTLKQVTDQLTQQKEKEKAFYGKMFK